MEITVQKFGGTSVGNSYAIQNLYNRVIDCNSDVKIVVSSAMSGVTDLLIKAAQSAAVNPDRSFEILEDIQRIHINAIIELDLNSDEIIEEFNNKISELGNILTGINYISELTLKILDKVQSFGELLSTFIMYNYFLKKSQKCVLLDSRDFIKTDSNFGEAKLDFESTRSQFSNFDYQPGFIYIFQGFIASDSIGNTTTLGRGGSDYSASIIGAALKQNGINVRQIEIWTDVDGIMTADPRIDTNAETVKEISYNDVLNLSFFGAKVVHPNTVKPAVELDIPVLVRNTFNPDNEGTSILQNVSNKKTVKVILKETKLIQIKDYNQKKLVEVTNRILHLLIASGSTIYHQDFAAYQSNIIYKESKINLDDYLSEIQYQISEINVSAFIGDKISAFSNSKKYIKGINDEIFLVID